jgi:hypothetical protein
MEEGLALSPEINRAMPIGRERLEVASQTLIFGKTHHRDYYSPLDDSNPDFSLSLSTSAVKNACTNDQKNQQTPNPKRMSIKGASPAKGAITVISNKPISTTFSRWVFIYSFS